MNPTIEKHTPGPWAWDGPPDNIHIVEAARPHIRICFLTSNGPTEANARLIAAAPKLLAALRVIADYAPGRDTAALLLRGYARDAIVEAEGK